MKTCIRAVSAILLSSIMYPTGAAAQAPGPRPVLTVPVVGTFQGGGDFNGTISVNRFEQRGAQVVAVGFVSGVLTRANHTRGTAVAGEMAWPVVVRSGGTSLARGFAPEKAVPMLVAYRSEPTAPRFLLAQSTPPCPVLDIALGPITVNLLGAQVALSAVSFSLSGQTGPLGDSRVRRVGPAWQRGWRGEPVEQRARFGHRSARRIDRRLGRSGAGAVTDRGVRRIRSSWMRRPPQAIRRHPDTRGQIATEPCIGESC